MANFRPIIFLLLLALIAGPRLHAGWNLKDTQTEGAADGVRHLRKEVTNGERTIVLQLALFETPRHVVRVIDRPKGTSVREAIQAAGCVAGVNGGYFHADFRPVGLVIAGGKEVHVQEKAKLLSGVLAATADRLFLLRPSQFRRGPRTLNALQSGPFLVDNARAVGGLSKERPARRTVILTDGKKKHALLVSDSLTLRDLSDILTAPGVVTEFKLTRALNLDGGSSTGFYFAGDKPFYVPNFKHVRNCVGVAPAR